MADVYDKQRSDEELRHVNGIEAGEERRMEEAAHSGHSRDQIKDLEDNLAAPSATQSGEVPSEDLAKSEENEGQSGGSGGIKDRMAKFSNKLQSSVKSAVLNPKKALIGGGMLSFLIVLFLTFSGFSAFELINLRENLLGHGNRFSNNVLARRRAKTFARMLQKMNKGTFEENINKEKFQKAFEKRGFKMAFDEKGKLTEFKFTAKDGTTRAFDLNSKDGLKATNEFFGDNKFGLEASRAYDRVLSSKGAMWRGPAARGVYSAYKFLFYDWLDRKPSDKAKTNKQKLADNLRNADTPPVDASTDAGKTKEQIAEENATGKDANGNPIKPDVSDPAGAMAGELNQGVNSADYAAKMRADPTATDEILGVGNNADVDALSKGTGAAIEGGLKDVSIDKIGGAAFKGSLDGIIKGFNIIGIAQGACEIKGVINFVNNARNVLLTIELARFSMRMLNAADDQKAGILSSEGLNIFMIYLHTPNPQNGKSYYASGGMRHIFGDKTAKPNSANLARYSVGRANSGILATIGSFINSIPGINHCKIVNNGFVTAGGFIVGIGAAIFSGGTEAAANIATMITLSAVKEIAIQIAIPILIKAGAHMIMNGYENGEMVGDAGASGFGALSGMIGGGNGLRPSTNTQIAAMEPQIQEQERQDIAEQSLFYRYLSPHNSESLATRVAMSMPHGLTGFMASITNGGLQLFGNATSFNVFSYFSPKVDAASDACDDPQIKKLNIATDPFCNPIMANSPDLDQGQTEDILRQNGMIDDKGNPTDKQVGQGLSFMEYAKDCFSGRPGVLYTASPDQAGNDSPEDDTCTQAGTALPGDNVGKYDRFAAFFGYLQDRDAMTEKLQ
ncbi:MAG TPA: hypothetical protein VLH86_01500 [Patescibacteria group bacterium]|nr:hypothetical protein [Patescibacteria group bacterium]